MTENQELPLCECGCGQTVTKKGNRFIKNHDKRGKKRSPETIKKISIGTSKAQKGIPCSDKRRLGLSKALKGRVFSDKWKENISKGKMGIPLSDTHRLAIKESHLKEKEPLPDNWKFEITTNKECSVFLGETSEYILSKIFKNVKIMPRGYHGYDFICNKNMKIDAKSSSTGNKRNGWGFHIRKNTIPDYFLCLAFDNREDLNPVHLWLIPGEVINHLTELKVTKTNLNKWKKYEQPIDKVILCCNEIKK